MTLDVGGIGTLNPFRYRGYYYDTETNLYYLKSRYYDPVTGRFINADELIDNRSVLGYNMYAYCWNNPVNMNDSKGYAPFWKKVGSFFYNIGNAALTSLEFELGVGIGVGIDLMNTATAELSRDTYVGIDDGKWVTGNVVAAEVSLLDSNISIGDTFDHRVEEGGRRVSLYGDPWDGPLDMIHYPDVTKENQYAFGPFVVNSSGDFLFELSTSIHVGAGGHVSAGVNITEFLERLFD